jgi:hypothetical protein
MESASWVDSGRGEDDNLAEWREGEGGREKGEGRRVTALDPIGLDQFE